MTALVLPGCTLLFSYPKLKSSQNLEFGDLFWYEKKRERIKERDREKEDSTVEVIAECSSFFFFNNYCLMMNVGFLGTLLLLEKRKGKKSLSYSVLSSVLSLSRFLFLCCCNFFQTTFLCWVIESLMNIVTQIRSYIRIFFPGMKTDADFSFFKYWVSTESNICSLVVWWPFLRCPPIKDYGEPTT